MNDFIKGWGSAGLDAIACVVLGAASFFAVEALAPKQASANLRTPSHSCNRPYDRTSEYAVDSFKDCIEDFVDEQKRAINRHSKAASAAVDDWNSFARGY